MRRADYDGDQMRDVTTTSDQFVISVCGDPATLTASASRTRALSWWFITISVVMHFCAIVALSFNPGTTDSGRGGTQLEAIGVEFVTSSVLEAALKVQSQAAASIIPAPIAEQDGNNSDSNITSQSATQATPKVPDVDPTPPILRTETSTQTEALQLPPPKPEPRPLEPVTDLTPQKPETAQTDTTARDAEAQGGVQVRSPQGSIPTSAAAGASPGTIQKYAIQVRDALAKTRPTGRGKRGSVTVTFTISLAGDVSLAQVTAASGIASLDEVAVEAIRSARFPKPPVGMTEKQLTYVIPFRFQ